MKKAIFILIVLVLTLLYYVGVLAKKETLPFSKEFFSVVTTPADGRPLDLKGIWGATSQAGERRSPANTTRELDQLYQLQLDKGIRNIPLLSTLLSREADRARENGDVDRSVALAKYSVKFSPDLPPFYFGLAKALWHQTPFQIQKVFYEIFRGFAMQFRHYPSSLKFFYNLFYILCNAILMTFIVFAIVVMAKYLPLYFYDLRRNLSQNLSDLLLSSIKILVLFVPFFLRLDILWAFMFWSLFLWGYTIKRERQAIVIFFILLVYLPFFIRSASTFLDSPQSDVILEISQANHEDWDETVAQKMQAWASTHPDDAEVLFTLGLIEKREGRYAQAEEWYRKATQQAPRFHEALSNLGNVYLAQKQPDLAIASYQEARHLHPNKAAYYFNLYRAYSQQTFLAGKTSQAFERARQLDPKLVDLYATVDSPNINRLAIDEVLSAGRLWGRSLNQFIGREGALYRLFIAWFEKIPSRIFLIPLFFIGYLIGVSRYGRAKRFLNRCPMCGSPTYRFYLGASDEESICFNCHRIFVQKEKIHPKIKEKKSTQLAHFQKKNHFVNRFLSFIFIGFSDLWSGRPFKGLLLLTILFIFVLRFVYWNGVVTLFTPHPPMIFFGWIFWGGLFVLFYVFSARKIYRLKPKYVAEKLR